MSETTVPNGGRQNYKEVSVENTVQDPKFNFVINIMETRVKDPTKEQQKDGASSNGATGTADTASAVNNDKAFEVSSIIVRNLPNRSIDGTEFAKAFEKGEYSKGSLKGSSKGKTERQDSDRTMEQ